MYKCYDLIIIDGIIKTSVDDNSKLYYLGGSIKFAGHIKAILSEKEYTELLCNIYTCYGFSDMSLILEYSPENIEIAKAIMDKNQNVLQSVINNALSSRKIIDFGHCKKVIEYDARVISDNNDIRISPQLSVSSHKKICQISQIFKFADNFYGIFIDCQKSHDEVIDILSIFKSEISSDFQYRILNRREDVL